jgi:hypothetical protein
MKAIIRKIAVTVAIAAASVTTGCASFGIEGDGASAASEQGQEVNVAMQQLEESGRGGGD